MGRATTLLLVAVVLVGYYIYIPLSDNIEEPWRLMWINTQMKTLVNLALFAEILGVNHCMNILMFIMSYLEVPPTSDENVTVMDTTFSSVPVRVYVPKRKAETLRRGVFYIHGGGSCPRECCYGLAPQYHFPRQFEDVCTALRWFLRQDVLATYGVDPQRVALSGDSAGGNLAAAVTHQIMEDPDAKIKPKAQALLYPGLQVLDMDLPSHRENTHPPLLPKSLMVRFWSEYFTTDRALEKAMLLNQHIPKESSHLFKFVNWTSLLPERFKKGHVYTSPTPGSSELVRKYPAMLDVRASPLLAEDSTLRRLPLTYVVTCQYDVLRDDGVMYVTRLQKAGVQVTHNHVEDGFHGTIYYNELKISQRIENQYISWLMENL